MSQMPEMLRMLLISDYRPVRLAYQPPGSSTSPLSTSQPSATSQQYSSLKQSSTNHRPPVRTNRWLYDGRSGGRFECIGKLTRVSTDRRRPHQDSRGAFQRDPLPAFARSHPSILCVCVWCVTRVKQILSLSLFENRPKQLGTMVRTVVVVYARKSSL
jgi:hypothetical protein